MDGLKILGTGSYIPDLRVSNEMFAKIVDTSDEWIISRTGIKSRHFIETETSLDLVKASCSRAIENAGISKSDIAVVICATVTSDYITPALATLLQSELDLPQEILSFDINGACSGFIYAMNTAQALLANYPDKYALICGCEILSRMTDFADRSTCVLFGDGAGAAVIARDKNHPYAFRAGAKGDEKPLFCHSPLANHRHPFAENKPKAVENHYLHMNGQEVFRFAVESINKTIAELKAEQNLANADIDKYILHQANLRIIESAARKMGEPMEKFYININEYGNTSAASIAIALDEMNQKGLLSPGDKLIIAGFGAGLCYGSAFITW